MHFSDRVFFSVCETSLQLSLVKVSQTGPISDDFRGGALDTARGSPRHFFDSLGPLSINYKNYNQMGDHVNRFAKSCNTLQKFAKFCNCHLNSVISE